MRKCASPDCATFTEKQPTNETHSNNKRRKSARANYKISNFAHGKMKTLINRNDTPPINRNRIILVRARRNSTFSLVSLGVFFFGTPPVLPPPIENIFYFGYFFANGVFFRRRNVRLRNERRGRKKICDDIFVDRFSCFPREPYKFCSNVFGRRTYFIHLYVKSEKSDKHVY